MDGTTIDDLHGCILRDTFGDGLSDDEAFLVFVLFHMNALVLSAPALTDRPGVQLVAAITQRHASEALASLWQGRNDERASSAFWYFRWNGEWQGYYHAEHLTPMEQERLESLKERLQQHPFISHFELED